MPMLLSGVIFYEMKYENKRGNRVRVCMRCKHTIFVIGAHTAAFNIFRFDQIFNFIETQHMNVTERS